MAHRLPFVTNYSILILREKERNAAKTAAARNLHPEEETLGSSLELQYKYTACSTLGHLFKLTVIRKNNQVLK